jgi:hypothetical protein
MALNKKVSKNNYSIYTLWLRITKKILSSFTYFIGLPFLEAGEAARKLDFITDAVMVANGAFFLNK